MKKAFIYTFIIASTMIFVSCQKNGEVQSQNRVEVSLSTISPDSKVSFGEKDSNVYPALWDANGESIKMIEVANGTYSTYSSSSYSVKDGGKSACFSFTINPVTAPNYDYYFLSPAASFNYTFPEYSSIGVSLNQTQYSRPASIDPATAILFSRNTGATTQGGDMSTEFSHISAYGKLAIQNLTVDQGEEIQSITVKANNKVLTGLNAYVWNTSTYAPVAGYVFDNVIIDANKINTASGTFDVWFSCWPFNLDANEKLSVFVTTDKSQYRKEITLTSAKSFIAGRVAEIGIDMSTAEKSSPINALYVIGDAVPVTGWTLCASPFIEVNPGVFVWEGSLIGGGTFRFHTVNDWFPSLMLQEGKLVYVTNYDANIHQHLSVQTSGNYQIFVDVRDFYNMVYSITPVSFSINSLCLVGDATPVPWALNSYPMVRTGQNTFTWTGNLNAGTFRLNPANDWFPSLMKDKAGNIVYVEEAAYNAELHDHFSISTAGNYTITVDLADRSAVVVNIQAN